MATEEQRDVSRLWSSISTTNAWGQKLTISNRTVSKLSFYLRRTGTVTGSVKFWIRKVSDDSILLQQNWGLGSTISTTPAWYEITFTGILINEEVYILVGEGNISNTPSNLIHVYDSDGNVKAGENMVRRSNNVYSDYPAGSDFGYKYTYGAPVVVGYSQAHII
ncbi:hypothetical protein LCGC14_3096730 [marine sediment metagenome]|uniref:CBM-cenC domain-containing protein n=1 Tax=marine sediment metagenome TaxID=412755 RepID=A0A0F8WXR4_9ZZZZ